MANNDLPGGHWRSGAEGPRDPKRTDQLERIADHLEDAADYQIRPEAVRPREANSEETGTARRAERAAGMTPDPDTRDDAEAAFERDLGEERR